MEVPDKKAWGDYKSDPELRREYQTFVGKSPDEAKDILVADPIRLHHLVFGTDEVFNYYTAVLGDFLLTDTNRENGDVASVFMNAIRARMERSPETFKEGYANVKRVLDVIASRQDFYDAFGGIYGSFPEHRDEIDGMYSAYLAKQAG